MIMIAALASLVVTGVVASGADRSDPADPCHGVVDNTDACSAPAAVGSLVAADTKAPAVQAGITPAKLSGEIGFVGVGLAIGGGAALLASFAYNPKNDDERLVRTVEQWGGAGLLVWSGLAEVSAAALAVFDPSTGDFKASKLYQGAD